MAFWRRDEPEPAIPSQPARSTHAAASAVPASEAAGREPMAERTDLVRALPGRSTVSTVGASVVIKGELSGDEELVIEGNVDGTVDLNQNVLIVGKQGKVSAKITAKTVVVLGEVNGKITASENVILGYAATVEADICAPRVAIDEQAYFLGVIDVRRPESA
jgi:cytoskeletal protein CcmA (bactofilin family)